MSAQPHGDPIAEALNNARLLASIGVRLFVAPPNWTPGHKVGFDLPYQWEKAAAADPRVVDAWQPGWALCAVGDGPVSFVDLDPPQGDTPEALEAALTEAGLMPYVYGRQRTPSGGAHLLVAGLDAPKAEGVIPGVDVRAGYADGSSAGFVFLAPTERSMKWDRSGPRYPYVWLHFDRSDLPGIGSDLSGAALSQRLRQGRQRQTPVTAPQPGPGASYAERVMSGAEDGARAVYSTEQAWAELEQRRQAVLDCTDHVNAHDAVIMLAWQLARFTQGGLMLGPAAEAWYAAVLTERWGGPDEGDWLAWQSAWARLGREGPADRAKIVTAAEMHAALGPQQPVSSPTLSEAADSLQFPEWMEASIQQEQLKITVRDEARRRNKMGDLADAVPDFKPLGQLLAQPDNATRWRVEGLWPSEGRIMLHAQYKAGKTTLLGNLVRALADGDPFLDHAVTPLLAGQERVLLLDLELSEDNLKRWMADQNVLNHESVLTQSLRGVAHRFAVTDKNVRARWAAAIRAAGVKVLIVDPIAPLMSALGIDENSNSEVGPFLTALDTLAAESGLSEIVVAHHAGHTGERTRGASRFRDWPDAEWSLVRHDEEGQPKEDAQRFFSAIGRDVSLTEAGLIYDPASRRLSITGGTRVSVSRDYAASQIKEYLMDNPGASVRDIEAAVRGRKATVGQALSKMLDQGLVRRESDGPKYRHYLNVPHVPPSPGTPIGSVPHPLGGTPMMPTDRFGSGGHSGTPFRGTPSDSPDPAPQHTPTLTRERQGLMDRLAGTSAPDTSPVLPEPPSVTESEPAQLPLELPEPPPEPKAAAPEGTKPETKAQERKRLKAEAKVLEIARLLGPDVVYPVVVQRGDLVTEVPLSDARTLLDGLSTLTVDVESSGVPVGHQAFELRLVQLGCEHFGVVLDPDDPEQADLIRESLGAAPVLRAHSSSADVVPAALAGLGDFDSMMARMDDTAVRAKLVDPSLTDADAGAGLKKISDRLLGDESESDPAEDAKNAAFKAAGWLTQPKATTPLEKNGWYQVPKTRRTFARYAGADVLDAALIGERLPRLSPAVEHRERVTAHMVSRIAKDGVPINGPLVSDLMAEHTVKRAEMQTAISAWTGIEHVGSDRQVADELLRMGVQLPYTKPTSRYPNGQPSVAAGVLETLKGELQGSGHLAEQLIEQVLDWRHHDTVVTLFLTPYDRLVREGDGRARPTVYTLGADTGRMSCVRPNFQQLPREGGVRAIITADPGMVFVGADFSSVEVRVAAALSGDQVLMQMLADGLDPHGFAAELVYGPNWTKAQRYAVKRGVFGRIYGGGVTTLAKQMGVPVHIAQKLIDAIDTLWPVLSAWTKSCAQAVERGLETSWETYSGAVVHLPKGKAHAAGNYKIQRTAREFLVDGLMNWRDTQWGNAIMWPVHDEFNAMVPIEDAEAATATLVRCMESELNGVKIVADPSEPSTYWRDSA